MCHACSFLSRYPKTANVNFLKTKKESLSFAQMLGMSVIYSPNGFPERSAS